MRRTKYLRYMRMPLNIHGPSLGIGAAIAVISILGTFIVLNSDLEFKPNSNNEKTKNTDSKNNNEKTSLSLFTDNASPPLGSKDAPITLIEFGDYQCFYCNRFFHTTEPDIVKNYVEPGKVKIIFKDFTIIGSDSVSAANAAHCANEENKFWEFHDTLYNNWKGENNGWASQDNLTNFARQVGLDQKSFELCMAEKRYDSIIKASYSDGQTLGLTGTPGFFIIGPDNSISKIHGAQPYDVFEKIFDSKLEK